MICILCTVPVGCLVFIHIAKRIFRLCSSHRLRHFYNSQFVLCLYNSIYFCTFSFPFCSSLAQPFVLLRNCAAFSFTSGFHCYKTNVSIAPLNFSIMANTVLAIGKSRFVPFFNYYYYYFTYNCTTR